MCNSVLTKDETERGVELDEEDVDDEQRGTITKTCGEGLEDVGKRTQTTSHQPERQ